MFHQEMAEMKTQTSLLTNILGETLSQKSINRIKVESNGRDSRGINRIEEVDNLGDRSCGEGVGDMDSVVGKQKRYHREHTLMKYPDNASNEQFGFARNVRSHQILLDEIASASVLDAKADLISHPRSRPLAKKSTSAEQTPEQLRNERRRQRHRKEIQDRMKQQQQGKQGSGRRGHSRSPNSHLNERRGKALDIEAQRWKNIETVRNLRNSLRTIDDNSVSSRDSVKSAYHHNKPPPSLKWFPIETCSTFNEAQLFKLSYEQSRGKAVGRVEPDFAEIQIRFDMESRKWVVEGLEKIKVPPYNHRGRQNRLLSNSRHINSRKGATSSSSLTRSLASERSNSSSYRGVAKQKSKSMNRSTFSSTETFITSSLNRGLKSKSITNLDEKDKHTMLRSVGSASSRKKTLVDKEMSLSSGSLPPLKTRRKVGHTKIFEEPVPSLPPLWKLLNELNEQKRKQTKN